MSMMFDPWTKVGDEVAPKYYKKAENEDSCTAIVKEIRYDNSIMVEWIEQPIHKNTYDYDIDGNFKNYLHDFKLLWGALWRRIKKEFKNA